MDWSAPREGMENWFKEYDSIIKGHPTPTQEQPDDAPVEATENFGPPAAASPAGMPSDPLPSEDFTQPPPLPKGPPRIAQAGAGFLSAPRYAKAASMSPYPHASPDAAARIEREIMRQAERQTRANMVRISPEAEAAWPELQQAIKAKTAVNAAKLRAAAGLGEVAEGAGGFVAGGLAGAAAEFLAPTLLAEGVTRLIDHMPKDRDFFTPLQQGEVEFQVDGKESGAEACAGPSYRQKREPGGRSDGIRKRLCRRPDIL